MPNSLKCKIKHLCHNRTITERERDRILKALEQEPCEDAVSRQSVKEQMIYYGFHAPDMTVTEFVEDHLSPVNPQKPKTGHWTIKQYQVLIENKQVPTVSGITFPSEPTACKIMYTYTHSDCESEEYLNKYNYCPNCGAKMVEPLESEGKE